MAEIKVDCVGETCPVPLVETRKAIRKAQAGDIIEVAIRKAQAGDIIEVRGTHAVSKKEIPMALKAMGLEVLKEAENSDGVWTIVFRR